MFTGMVEWELDKLEAYRLQALWNTSNIIESIYATAGKSCERPPNARQIYEGLTGKAVQAPEDTEEEDDDPTSSLAEAKAARREREAANGRQV